MSKDFLSIIVDNKQKEIEAAEKITPLAQLQLKAAEKREKRPFFENLKREKSINVIAEIKRASPSKGDIAIDLDPSVLAAEYEEGGAVCLSVLTDTKYFKGSFNDFTKARHASTLPMLRKDFIISPYQIYESVVLGADAILLIARILTREKMKELLEISTDLGLDTLVEIHSEKDLETANYANAKLIGINNRNLSSFETDLETATTLVNALGHDQIPVAASGISSRDDIERNLNAGIHNFLIGESLAKSKNTVTFLKSLIEKTTTGE